MGCLNAAADCLDIPWLCATSIYLEVTTGPMGKEGQGDGVRHPADSWAPFEPHVARTRTRRSQRVTVDCPTQSPGAPLAGPWWTKRCSYCTSGLLATDGLLWLVVGIRCPSAPSPSPNTPTWYPFLTPRVFSAATGLLQASSWPHHEETGANPARPPQNAELGSALRAVLTKLD